VLAPVPPADLGAGGPGTRLTSPRRGGSHGLQRCPPSRGRGPAASNQARGAATACNPICRGALSTFELVFGPVTLRVMRRDRGREHMTPVARKELEASTSRRRQGRAARGRRLASIPPVARCWRSGDDEPR
jgi:hypothetical protein